MILRLEIILLVVSYKWKNIIFHEENFKLTKNNTFNDVFCNRSFPYYRSLLIIQKLLGFHESWIIFLRSSKILLFSILKMKYKIFKYSYFKNSFPF